MKLWAKIIIAIALGILTGFILGPKAEVLKPIGTLFLNLLNMLIVPLIFASMASGITNIPDTHKLGRVGGMTLVLYALTTLFAIVLGISLTLWLGIGESLHLAHHAPAEIKALPPLGDLLLSMIPKNPIKAFAEGNILQIIVFAAFFGTALNLVGQKAKAVTECVNALAQVMLKMTSYVMMISPIGVFALMAWACGSFGLDVLLPVGKFLSLYYAAAIIHIVVIFCGILWGIARLKPLPFFKSMAPVIACAASTCSSSASLPIALECSTERLGVSKPLANFVLPLGCSLNMNGSALFQAMGAVFMAQAYGIELEWQHLVTLTSTVILATLGTASIPGGGLLMLSIVFSSMGIPLEGIAILAGIDRLRDMATTILNITGDAVCAVVVAKQEGELNEAIYYQSGIVTPA
jgi:dicarboxylate/amino acid:cation (Na+ or H+) symporter, DAACS family